MFNSLASIDTSTNKGKLGTVYLWNKNITSIKRVWWQKEIKKLKSYCCCLVKRRICIWLLVLAIVRLIYFWTISTSVIIFARCWCDVQHVMYNNCDMSWPVILVSITTDTAGREKIYHYFRSIILIHYLKSITTSNWTERNLKATRPCFFPDTDFRDCFIHYLCP